MFSPAKFPFYCTVMRLRILATVLVIGGSSAGCSVHYGNSRHGIEHVWGVGQVTWTSKAVDSDIMAISSGFRIPGLVWGFGPDFLGVSLGYRVHERLQIVTNMENPTWTASRNGVFLIQEVAPRWRWGHFRIGFPSNEAVAQVSGKASAGLELGFRSGLPIAAVGADSQLATTIAGDHLLFEFEQSATAWPYFNFPSSQVAVVTATHLSTTTNSP
jgi:hypothetical protein